MVFAQQVYGYGRAGDVLLAFSTSGNSANVANAHCGWPGPWAAPASSSPGAPGGRCADLAEVAVLLPETETYKVQELTLAPLPLPLRHAGGRGVRSEQETPPLRESVFPGDFN